MRIRKISLIIGIAVAILGLNYLLNLYNEKFVDVNSKDYIIEQFTKENIGNAYAGTIRTASRFTSGHSAGVDSDS